MSNLASDYDRILWDAERLAQAGYLQYLRVLTWPEFLAERKSAKDYQIPVWLEEHDRRTLLRPADPPCTALLRPAGIGRGGRDLVRAV